MLRRERQWKKKKTCRGFTLYEFRDIYGAECSIQKSSLASDDAIWLGLDKGTHHMGQCLGRMHVDKKLAKKLITVLKRFVETGELRKTNKRGEEG